MAIARHRVVGRTWFADPRSPERRMSVSTHLDEGIAVISLWTGRRCTGTFRLPVADAARLVATLAEGMSRCLTPAPTTPPSPPRGRRAAVLAWVRRRCSWPSPGRAPHLRLLK